MSLDIVVVERPAVVRVQLTGDLDLDSCVGFDVAIVGVVSDRRPTQVVIDATALEFVDTSGLRALLRAADTVAEAGARMGVVNPNSQLQRLLEMTDSGSRVGYEA